MEEILNRTVSKDILSLITSLPFLALPYHTPEVKARVAQMGLPQKFSWLVDIGIGLVVLFVLLNIITSVGLLYYSKGEWNKENELVPNLSTWLPIGFLMMLFWGIYTVTQGSLLIIDLFGVTGTFVNVTAYVLHRKFH